jgi:phytoene desaturase
VKKVIIIGAGIGGLATANLLAASGYEVVIYEQNDQPGGRAGRLHIDGFTFDTGPSWYLMPEVFEQYFRLFGEDVSTLLELQRLDPAYKVFFEGEAAPVTIHADLEADKQTFEQIESGSGARLERYLARSEDIYTAAIEQFLYTNFERPQTMLRPATIKTLPRMAVAALTPIDRYVGRYFQDSRLRRIMEYPMVFLGTSPYEAPAIYSLMSHMDFNQGVFYPRRGLYAIIEALVAIGTRSGVTYHYNTAVSKIESIQGIATGVRLENGTVDEADIIISNADLHFTETQLLAPANRTYDAGYWKKKQAGPSALLMYLGVKGSLPELDHHNLLFTEDWRANFDAIFKTKTWPTPASIYICKPSQTDATVAPAGHENMFVLVPAPANPDVTPQQLEALSETYLDQIVAMTGIADLKDRIVVKRLAGPNDFAHTYNAWQGTALGLSHRLNQSALFRPSNHSKRLNNLYYVGANTTPGVGLPMCLIGAELVYKRLTGDTTSTPITSLLRSSDA